MNLKISGLRRGLSGDTSAFELDLASAINRTYRTYVDSDYLAPRMKNIFNTVKIPVGTTISRRLNELYLDKLTNIRSSNYYSKWYESGWFRNFRASGKKMKFAQTYYRLDQDPFSTENSQAYCLDRILTANFEDDGGFPYGLKDYYGYPEKIYSGQKFKICGFQRNDLPAAPFITPYKNIFEIADHSGYQIGSIGRNYWSKQELLSFGISEDYATLQASGIQLNTRTGIPISYNKIYFQDNIPNLNWCLSNRCSFIYTEIVGERTRGIDDPQIVKEETIMPTLKRVFVFSGAVNWIPTGGAPRVFPLGYGPYFQPGNSGLFRLYNNNFSIRQSGTLNDNEVYHFHVINTGDIPKNFYVSSRNAAFDVLTENAKTSQFVYPNNHPLSGQLVEYWTVGKNNSLKINYLSNYIKTGSINRTLANGTQIYRNTGALILHEVTGTILDNGKLSFLTKDTSIAAINETLVNNSRIFFDDYFFISSKGDHVLPLQFTGNDFSFSPQGALLKVLPNGLLSESESSVFGLTSYVTGSNEQQRLPSLRTRYADRGQKAVVPDYQVQANIKFSSPNENIIDILNTDKQYLKYREGFSGLFRNNSNQLIYTKGDFDPKSGAVQLDILFRLRREDLPTFNLSNNQQEFITIYQNGNSYTYDNTITNTTLPLSGLILKKGFVYNMLQHNNTTGRPLAIKGDISGARIIEPNVNARSGNYRLVQFTVNPSAENVEYFSLSSNPILGKFRVTGDNIKPTGEILGLGSPVVRARVFNIYQIPEEDRIARSGAKFLYRVNNDFCPQLYLESDKNYKLTIFSGYTGFYFYTGSDIFGSGRNEYSGQAISASKVSGILIDPNTLQITGYTLPQVTNYIISAAHIPDNLYYGDKYSAYAGNKINKINPLTALNLNRFSIYTTPIITGIFNIQTSDVTKENMSINYKIVQDTGSLPIR